MKHLFLTTALVAATAFAVPALAHDHGGDAEYGDEAKVEKTYGDKDKKDYADKKKDMGTIVDVATANGSFSTLVAAVKAADLVDALSGEGPLTVFAPTDEAFAALPEGTVEDLLKPENKEQLQAVLKYHVVSGKIKSGDIADGSTDVETLEGSSLTVEKGEGGVTIDGANVVSADVKASNGVIHVIDAVILP